MQTKSLSYPGRARGIYLLTAIILALASSACAAGGPMQIGVTVPEVLQSLRLEDSRSAASLFAAPRPAVSLLGEPVAWPEPGREPTEPAVPKAAAGKPEAARAEAAAQCPAEGTRVLLIGDSLTVGLSRPMAAVAARCGTPFYHHGVIGSHVTEWVSDRWLLPRLAEAQPTVVLVSLGGNDFLRPDSERVHRAIRTFVAKIRTRGIKLLWIAPPTMPFEDQAQARQAWQRAMGEVHKSWFPSETLELEREEDKIHLTAAQNHAFARTLWHWLANTTATASA